MFIFLFLHFTHLMWSGKGILLHTGKLQLHCCVNPRGKGCGSGGFGQGGHQALSEQHPCWGGSLSTSESHVMTNPVIFPFSSERLLGADSARWSQPARPCAHRRPADLANQHGLLLPAGIREHWPAPEPKLGAYPGWGSVLFVACTGGSVPHTRVPHPAPISLHPLHHSVQRPTNQGSAPLSG